jgi:hypothetical protein
MRTLIPALMTFVLTVVALVPNALALPQHGDEAQWGWAAGYYGSRLRHLDLSLSGAHGFADPGWAPFTYWTIDQPMGGRLVYAFALLVSGAIAPSVPFSWADPDLQGPETHLVSSSLFILRCASILCAALGLALFAFRLGWPGMIAAALFIAIPHVRIDLAEVRAEGPLLLGFGLCAISYGSCWFAPACGIAATFKLMGLITWPLAFFHGFGRTRWKHVAGFVVAVLTWSLLTPQSWLAGGPLYLPLMIVFRLDQNRIQATQFADRALGGLFVKPRYFWPLELLLLLALMHYVCFVLLPHTRLWPRLRPYIVSTPGKAAQR